MHRHIRINPSKTVTATKAAKKPAIQMNYCEKLFN